MMSFGKSANKPRSEAEVISKGLGTAQEIVRETGEALRSLTGWERAMHVFWLFGPFILLIERSPADLWLSVIALTFAGRSIARREGWWLGVKWVRLAVLFGQPALCLRPYPHCQPIHFRDVCMVSLSLFAMAVASGSGKTGVCCMRCCYQSDGHDDNVSYPSSRDFTVGVNDGRLSWPYGDLVPGTSG